MLIIIGVFLAVVACNSDTTIEPRPDLNIVYYDFDADWSLDGSRIVFQRSFSYIHDTHPGMYFYNFSDSSLTLLLDGDGYTSPRFSPDGQWIVFSYMKNIYKIKADGDSLTQLTGTPPRANSVWWETSLILL